VTQPQLYKSYGTEKIVSFFGSPGEAQSLCNGQWLIFPKTVICLASVGERPAASHFGDASHFYWVADQPYHVSPGPYSHFVPAQVIGSAGKERSIHLFVSLPDSQESLYVGELEPSYMQQAPGGGNHGMARFELRPALPSAVWLRLGGLQLGNLDFTPLDRSLDSLRSPTTVEDRLGVLQQLVDFWHGPIKPEDGMSDAELAGVPLPLPLRWWYRWAGKRTEIMSGQNILFSPVDEHHKYWQLAVEGDYLRFYIENQGVYQWSTLPHGDDPPVFGRYESTDPWEQEDVTLSEHLILVCLFEALMCHAKYGASAAWLEEEKLSEIARTIPTVAIAPWRWMDGTRFFAGRGAFICAAGNGECNGKRGYSVWIGATTEHPLQFLKPSIDDAWEYVAI
jgi:hypothetical protein